MNWKWVVLLLTGILATSVVGGSTELSTNNGMFKIYYPENDGNGVGSSSCSVAFLGVGTAMSSGSYDKLSSKLAEKGIVVVVVDHVPGNMVKTDSNKFAAALIEAKASLFSTWLNGASLCTSATRWLVGGHSAGGQAAHDAVSKQPDLADAMLQLDPFNINGLGTINLPSLIWGFEVTTCFVSVGGAGERAYKHTTGGKRVYYQVQRKYGFNPCGWAPKYYHCSFADGGCPACTNCMFTPNHFYNDVANSVDAFVQTLDATTWDNNGVTVSTETPTRVYSFQAEPAYSPFEEDETIPPEGGASQLQTGHIIGLATAGSIIVVAAAMTITYRHHKRNHAEASSQAQAAFPSL